jgi:hypothetical protein
MDTKSAKDGTVAPAFVAPVLSAKLTCHTSIPRHTASKVVNICFVGWGNGKCRVVVLRAILLSEWKAGHRGHRSVCLEHYLVW